MANNIFLPPSPVSPPFLTISSISNSYPCSVVVVETNTYQIGQLCYFSVPFSYGMFQINSLSGSITNIVGQTFTIDIDTSNFDVFVIPSPGKEMPATLCSAGSRNLYNFLQVPFHSLDGQVGN